MSRRGKRTHGMSKTPEYTTWMGMRKRCSDRATGRLRRKYYDRGIRVCVEWERSFDTFIKDMGPRPSASHSIDRIDGTKGYEPENCRWTTPDVQGRNTTKTKIIEWNGQRRSVREWATLIGIDHKGLLYRLKHWPLDVAMTSPSRRSPRRQ